MKTKIVLASLLMAASISSCQKEAIDSVVKEKCNEILYFESEQEFIAELEIIQNKSKEELIEWERENGFISIELEAEKIYSNIDPNEFETIDQLKEFVNRNNEYLQLIEEENGEYTLETKYYNILYKYFLNQDRIFQVGDKMYKAYSECLISVDESKVEELKNSNFEMAQKL